MKAAAPAVKLFEAPAWQSSAPGFAATGCGQKRAIADVAAVGNPNTGVDVFDSTPEGREPTGWSVFGGTSVSSPIIAAEFGLAGGAQGVAYPAATLYAHLGDSADSLRRRGRAATARVTKPPSVTPPSATTVPRVSAARSAWARSRCRSQVTISGRATSTCDACLASVGGTEKTLACRAMKGPAPAHA